MIATTSIPPPDPADNGEVTEALDVAGQLWRTGNHQDAIRWVRRAAEAADQAGDSQRMSALARAGADLEQSLTAAPPTSSSPPPPVRTSTPPPLPTRPASLPPPRESSSRMRAKTPPPLSSKTTPPPLPPQPSRPPPAVTTPPQGRLRIRVSIKTSVLDPTLLVVRRLEDGKALPAGTSEGWLETTESTSVDAAQVPRTNGKSAR
jgi:hypothetical protein